MRLSPSTPICLPVGQVAACNAARQFTDTANFTLRCGVCQIGLKVGRPGQGRAGHVVVGARVLETGLQGPQDGV